MAPRALSVASDNTWKASVKKEEHVRWNHAAGTLLQSRASHLRFAGEQALTKPEATSKAMNLHSPATTSIADGATLPSASTSSFSQPQPTKSAAISFLEEQIGGNGAIGRAGTKDLLEAHGGRAEYLKRRTKYDVVERYGRPLTSSQVLGMHGGVEAQAPQHGHKSTIRHSFYRQNGAGL